MIDVSHLLAIDLTWESTLDWVLGAPLQILVAVVVAFVARWLAHRAITKAVDASIVRSEASRAKRERNSGIPASAAKERYRQRTLTMGSLLRSIATCAIAVVTALTVMSLLGIPLAPLLASAGVGGVALGFGAQSLVKDFLSGMFMMLEDQYGVGDLIDTGAVVGTVEAVSLRVTRVRDMQGVVWYVRNGEIVQIANRSQGWQNGSVDVPVSSDEDPERAIAVITKAVEGMETEEKWSRSMLEPATVAGVDSITAGTMIIKVLVKCAPNEHWGVQREILERTKVALQKAGVRGPVLLPGAFTLDTVRNDAAAKPANPSQD